MKQFLGPFNKNNPILVQILGVCSALAVTAQLKPAVIMSLSVIAVCGAGNFIISLIRKTIPPRIRIIVQLVIVAALVILVDQILQAFYFEMSKFLSVFVGLIITNCIIMGRIEGFALSNPPIPSLLDGIANGIGYGIVLVIVGFVRELLGSGTIWNHPVIPPSFYEMGYINNGLMILPPMALIIVGTLIWVQNSINQEN
ncbi:MAG TPA: NADH:ubiquinone reductase (Na(+)-transporting) subunit D [Bacteroidales bacterium]|jgi:Na+-transporting NADH:ubiquinone oxidoreductase subunit D|nr:NADH:ubiquinone reductase (Na(+)-transporting) subunit D [Bacteroidales bacterium]HPY80763.1 NADH:ubiquinone reductase (Na(+)-transporting) subunit D [Bacteroidales bacterium]HQA86992.1 NADH:ubiquinone reductase (Na(+)-transporting) subunit D [Bacteroidales bacterium]HRT13649.1 NADH:ubiquinone reductase (Na(+)-transporting) subunit D [Bacteroidales bacterium]HXK73799.1 NADH:ubiquinone reductase (Na(+)-transporting) subunit D [Bacteroidales bacterium]